MREIVLDTNIFVLLVVGLTDKELIQRHKRTRSFSVCDFEMLQRLLARFDRIVTTPHILAETSNLISQSHAAPALRKTLAHLIRSQREEFPPAQMLSQHGPFVRLGLTDCAILDLVTGATPFVTDDLDLYLAAVATNPAATNFNHLRDQV